MRRSLGAPLTVLVSIAPLACGNAPPPAAGSGTMGTTDPNIGVG